MDAIHTQPAFYQPTKGDFLPSVVCLGDSPSSFASGGSRDDNIIYTISSDPIFISNIRGRNVDDNSLK